MNKTKSNPTIFLSYCHANKSYADLIDEDFLSMGIVFKRDIRDIKYRDSIKEFMQKISKHDFVVMIISDAYLHTETAGQMLIELFNEGKIEIGKE